MFKRGWVFDLILSTVKTILPNGAHACPYISTINPCFTYRLGWVVSCSLVLIQWKTELQLATLLILGELENREKMMVDETLRLRRRNECDLSCIILYLAYGNLY